MCTIVGDSLYLLKSSGGVGRPGYTTNLVPDDATELGLGFTDENEGHVEAQAAALLRGLDAAGLTYPKAHSL